MRLRPETPRVALSLALMLVPIAAGAAASGARLLAAFPFAESRGERVRDAVHRLEGRVVGGASWTDGVAGSALQLNGHNSVRVPADSLVSPSDAVSVSVWMRGRSESFRWVEGYRGIKGPSFQVCGDTLYLAGNSFVPAESDRNAANFRHWSLASGASDVFTGTADLSLDRWEYRQRTRLPLSGLEPKLQVVGARIYYLYFGKDARGAHQIWAAHSNIDGSGWEAIPVTSESPGYRVEQVDNLQVVDGRIYFSFPKLDSHGQWQMWTARLDPRVPKLEAIQRTQDHGWLASLQVVDRQIYYLFMKAPIGGQHFETGNWLERPIELFVAVSAIDGSNWRVLRRLPAADSWSNLTGWGAFKVHKDAMYLSYSTAGRLHTARMNLDGTGWSARVRTVGKGHASALRGGIQIIGDQIYYAYGVVKPDRHAPSQAGFALPTQSADSGADSLVPQYEIWTATSHLDGTGWMAARRSASPPMPPYAYSYKALRVVGARLYLGTTRINGSEDPVPQEVLGVGGSNLVNKGDAFGIGLTEQGEVRGFINAGEDYLYRGEAPSDTGGAVADAKLSSNELNFWHNVVMTYDRQTLKVYVDGALRASTPYTGAIRGNPFPTVIGDGFQGAITDVKIFGSALSAQEVGALYAEVVGADRRSAPATTPATPKPASPSMRPPGVAGGAPRAERRT